MTVIDEIELDDITYNINDMKSALKNNKPIEEKLNVIAVLSNPCLYSKRYKLLKEFVKRIENDEENVNLFIVELIYGDQKYAVTDSNNKNHLQIKTDVPLWHKENMINLAVKYLLPADYKAFAWIDSDIEFESFTWVNDTLKLLNGYKDVVQLFSHCVDMNYDNTTLNIFNGFGYNYCRNKKYVTKNIDYWHPGYAWAITRTAYEKIGGLFDKGVLGSGDNIMALSFINNCKLINNINYSKDYSNSMLEYQSKVKGLRLGHVPGVIRHHYHGTKQNRRYTERWKILINHKYSPNVHITYDSTGIIIPTDKMTEEFKNDIMKYFIERKEDD
jgi:hypothetical protein